MNYYSVVHIQGQGYGYITPKDWAGIPVQHRDRVHVLAMFNTELGAQRAYSALPQEWVGKPGLHYWGGEWWQSTGMVTIHTGQKIELNIPADCQVPVVQHRGGLS